MDLLPKRVQKLMSVKSQHQNRYWIGILEPKRDSCFKLRFSHGFLGQDDCVLRAWLRLKPIAFALSAPLAHTELL